MALFNKNPNETAYVGGKKHWTDVIKNSGPGELLIWRQPEEDFNTNSTLVVMPGEEAIFIKGGVIEQIFENGTYKLSTENYPFVSRLRNAFSGGISTFNCVVYFVRKAHSAEITWGTETPIQVRDPVMGIMTSVRAYGAYKIQIENASVFLTKLLGNNIPFATQDEMDNYFINEYQQYIKSSLAKAIKASNDEILGICAEQDKLAAQIQPILQEVLDAYGLKLVVFSIANITIPENDPNRQMLEDSFARRGVRRQDAFGKKDEQDILGISWGQREAAEILRDVANNPGAGGVASAGAGLGMGLAAGSIFGGMAQQVFSPMQQQPQQQPVQPAGQPGRFTQKSAAQNSASSKCPACGADNAPDAKFCNECGSKIVSSKKLCSVCGAEMPDGAKFCNECGSKTE